MRFFLIRKDYRALPGCYFRLSHVVHLNHYEHLLYLNVAYVPCRTLPFESRSLFKNIIRQNPVSTAEKTHCISMYEDQSGHAVLWSIRNTYTHSMVKMQSFLISKHMVQTLWLIFWARPITFIIFVLIGVFMLIWGKFSAFLPFWQFRFIHESKPYPK